MIWLVLLALQAPPPVEQGSKLFAKSCATGYCHGAEGAAARGPRLKGRQFERAYLVKVTRDGIPSSAMPAWKDRFSVAEIEAVVDYIVHLNGGKVDSSQPTSQVPVAHTAPGRSLYHAQCAACHQTQGLTLTANSTWPTGTPGVVQLHLQDGETFPAHIVSEGQGLTVALDLTDKPIRRSLETAEIASRAPSPWAHPALAPDDWARIQAWLMLPLR